MLGATQWERAWLWLLITFEARKKMRQGERETNECGNRVREPKQTFKVRTSK